MIARTILFVAAAAAGLCAAHANAHEGPHLIDEARTMSLRELGAPPADPSNRWAGVPQAAALGERLFFDARLSSNGQVACSTCHDPKRQFQDGTPLGKGVGTTGRRTMPIAGTAHNGFFFWDGRKDSAWAQALGPLESAVEHGGTRAQYAHVVAAHYRGEYERLFGALPDLSGVPGVAGPVDDPAARKAWNAMTQAQRDDVTQVFVNIGKAIAAYERGITFTPTRFDRFVDEWTRTGRAPEGILDARERAGFALFAGKANCTQCHNGPLLTNGEFHNTGVPAAPRLPLDRGRAPAVAAVKVDEFNCHSRWSDAKADQCAELDFLSPAAATRERAFKVPSLRGVAGRAPYMHAGQFGTLREVLQHYNRAAPAPAGRSEVKPLHLDADELDQLEAFLRTLG